MVVRDKTIMTRFFAKVSEPDSNGCMRWTGAHVANGYGQIRYDGRVVYAHRVAYELMRGPIPEGLYIDHLCRVRDCVNPEHLEPVTHKENIMRGEAPQKLWGVQSVKTHCPRNHPYSEENTYRYQGEHQCRTCKRDRKRERRAAKRAEIDR